MRLQGRPAYPLCVLSGGIIAPVPAYNSNGLWLRSPAELAEESAELRDEGAFQGLKLRLGREHLADDIASVEAGPGGVGSEMRLMGDFNQGLHLGELWNAAMRLMISVSPGSRSPLFTTTSRA